MENVSLLPVVYHPDYQAPLRGNHRLPMSKYGYLREVLQNRRLMKPGGFFAPVAFDRSQLMLAHSEQYVDRAIGLRLTPAEIRQIGLPCTQRVIRRSRLSCSGTTLAGWLALEHGIACSAAGGSHHAHRESGAGFCIFNDVAVAARNLLAQGIAGPVLIVDADVHQGDGTAEIFQDDSSVFTFSIHAHSNFPFRKSHSDLDVALEDGTTGSVYLHHLAQALDHAFRDARPRLVFYNAGVDVHESDRLGRLSLTANDIRLRDQMVIHAAQSRGLPIACVLGGGYSDDPMHLAGLHAIVFEEARKALDTR